MYESLRSSRSYLGADRVLAGKLASGFDSRSPNFLYRSCTNMDKPSYHDLHITTGDIKRTSIFNLPFNVQVVCTRVGGWEVWNTHGSTDLNMWTLLGGEYDFENPLKLDIDGTVIVNSFGIYK